MSLILPTWTPPTADDFPRFYRSVWRRQTLPWHHELAERLCTTDTWPSRIDGPEIEAILDIALYWIAVDADRTPSRRRAPDRVVWLTDARGGVARPLEALRAPHARPRAGDLERIAARLRSRGAPRVHISAIREVGRLERGMLLVLGEGPVACSLLP